ncbi:hypothetical protein FVEN_g10332 [Fusarium venenatum]|uniref:Uncharacterized protein n=1 Tax=Fusarium venenatum TaxID=56646 RepID=A0A2L2TR78_9HYPO|nr:uncharacterized protein FVRRES_06601 [Fusarium venenatum]KAG8351664.1 hypothetical protein FVEN_g10332 [Fusarium venenatum]CEI62165.1 unnamed protein product [Fusarium venenatum]
MVLSPFSGRPILSATDEAVLVWLGLASAGDEYGNRQLHKRLAQPGSALGFYSCDNGHCFETNADAFITIPGRTVSEATIHFLGFTAEKTAEIWEGWVDMYLDLPRVPNWFLCGFALDYINTTIDASNDKDDATWRRVMTILGVAASLQDFILDPAHRHIRAKHSCASWIKQTIQERYNRLRNIQTASRSRAELLEPTI